MLFVVGIGLWTGAKTRRHLDENLRTVNNAATVWIKTPKSRWKVLTYNFPLWPSDEKAKLWVHKVKPFLKILETVEVVMSNLFARSSRKRASLSRTSVKKISSSTASAVDRVVANGVRNITICKNTPHVGKPVYWCVRELLPRIMVARKMHNCSFFFSCSSSFTTVTTASSVCVL